MLSSMEVTMIRRLAERGATISAIARQMGIDPKTVRNALKEPVQPPVPESAPSVLDPNADGDRQRRGLFRQLSMRHTVALLHLHSLDEMH